MDSTNWYIVMQYLNNREVGVIGKLSDRMLSVARKVMFYRNVGPVGIGCSYECKGEMRLELVCTKCDRLICGMHNKLVTDCCKICEYCFTGGHICVNCDKITRCSNCSYCIKCADCDEVICVDCCRTCGTCNAAICVFNRCKSPCQRCVDNNAETSRYLIGFTGMFIVAIGVIVVGYLLVAI